MRTIPRGILCFMAALLACLAPAQVPHGEDPPPRDDIVISDFESETYGDWTVTGTAFGPGPARGTLPNQMPVEGFEGERLVNSYFQGDGTTGTLTSPSFVIERTWLNFLIGGGKHPGETCINLVVDGKTVRTATGPNAAPGGSERLEWHSWNVAEFAGKKAVLEIVDRHTGGWGHINVDSIRQSDRRRQAEPARRQMPLTARYLFLPVKTGAPKRRMTVAVGERPLDEFEIELAETPQAADFEVFVDLGRYRDSSDPASAASLTLAVDALPAGSKALDGARLGDELPADLYREKDRPQFHFTSRRGWLNDPNGLVHYDGEYHLYYQHNPFGWDWGNMHWGHAVSRDLVHWRELPIALTPPRFGDWCFSGSAVVDRENLSGFGSKENPPLIAAFTSTGRGECLVYSLDKGRTWSEFPENPVIRHTGRDPRLVWHAPTRRWIIAVYDEEGGARRIAFYSSADFHQWTFESTIDGFFECPDLVEMPVSATERAWLLYGADGEYLVGEFDGRRYTPRTGKQRLWHGRFYAAQTVSHVPDGRVVQIGWANGIAFPGMPFNQQMTVPVELSLVRRGDGFRLRARPVRELEALHGAPVVRENVTIDPAAPRTLTAGEAPLATPLADGELQRVRIAFEANGNAALDVALRGVTVTCDPARGEVRCGELKLPLPVHDGRVELELLLDRRSLELFAGADGWGETAAVIACQPDATRSVRLASAGGVVRVAKLTYWPLKSAWQGPPSRSADAP